MKKILTMTAVLAILAITLTGCGSNKVIKPSDFLQEDEHSVWYYCETENIEKDTRITTVVEFNGGEVSFYPLSGISIGNDFNETEGIAASRRLTLGDVAGMSDDEVVEKAKSLELEMLDEAFKNAPEIVKEWRDKSLKEYKYYRWPKDNWEQLIQSRYETLLSNVEALDNAEVLPLAAYAKLALITDGTGNYTDYECLRMIVESIYIKTGTDGNILEGDNYLIDTNDERDQKIDASAEFVTKGYLVNLMNPVWATPIYDSYFGGFTIEGKYSSNYSLVRQCKENTEFELDEPTYEHDMFTVDPDDVTNYLNE